MAFKQHSLMKIRSHGTLHVTLKVDRTRRVRRALNFSPFILVQYTIIFRLTARNESPNRVTEKRDMFIV